MSVSRNATVVGILVLGVGFTAPLEAGQTEPLLVADAASTNTGPAADADASEEASTSSQVELTHPEPTGFQRLNDDWPSWLQVGLHYRGRVEGSSGLDSGGGRDDTYYLNRIRLNTSVSVNAWLRGFAQFQDAQTLAYDVANHPKSHTNTVDLRQGHIEAFQPGMSSVGVRVGRQTLSYGNERLVGALEWTNTSRAFDAVTGWWSNDIWRFEAFVASVVRIEQGRFDRHRDDETFLWVRSRAPIA